MTLSIHANPDGSINITGGGVIVTAPTAEYPTPVVTLTAFDHDLLPIVEGLAHADAKHTVADLVSFALRGRSFVNGIWGKLTGVKTVVDGAFHAAQIEVGKDFNEAWSAIVKETNEVAAQGILEAQQVLAPGTPVPANAVKLATATAVPAAPVAPAEAPAGVAEALAEAAAAPEVIIPAPAEAAPAAPEAAPSTVPPAAA